MKLKNSSRQIYIYIKLETKGFEEMNNILNSLEPDVLIFCEPDETELKDIIKMKLSVPFIIIKKFES